MNLKWIPAISRQRYDLNRRLGRIKTPLSSMIYLRCWETWVDHMESSIWCGLVYNDCSMKSTTDRPIQSQTSLTRAISEYSRSLMKKKTKISPCMIFCTLITPFMSCVLSTYFDSLKQFQIGLKCQMLSWWPKNIVRHNQSDLSIWDSARKHETMVLYGMTSYKLNTVMRWNGGWCCPSCAWVDMPGERSDIWLLFSRFTSD